MVWLLMGLAAPAWADRLSCYEPSATVSGARMQFTGTATSVTAKVLDPNDTLALPAFTPTMTDRGENSWTAADFTLGASPAFGEWTIRYDGTVNNQTEYGADTFEVRAQCPLKPTTAGQSLDLTSGDVQVQYGTATGQLSCTAGVCAVNATQANGSALQAAGGYLWVDSRLFLGTAYAAPTTAGIPEVEIAPGGLKSDAMYLTTTVSAEGANSLTLAGSPDPIAADDVVNGWAVRLFDGTTKDPKPGGYALIRDSTAATNVLLLWTDLQAIAAVNDYADFVPVDSLTGVLQIYTVVSSADCTNSATLFDSTMTGGSNALRESGIKFLSGALASSPPEVRRASGFNANGCVSVNQAFSGTPAAGDQFIVVNQ